MADMTTSDWTSLLGPALTSLSGLYGGSQLANTATQQAQASQFRPVGVTTRFGKSGFNYDPTTGQLTGAGYQVAPDVAAMREGLLGMAGTGLGQAAIAQGYQPNIDQAAQGLFSLGQQYVAQDPNAVAQQWMNKQQQLLAPSREQENAALANSEFNRGTYGLATGATQAGYGVGDAGLAASNPRYAALANSRALADATMAANAQKYGQQNVNFGSGLLTGGIDLSKAGYGLQTSALQPYTNYIQGAQNAENLGQGAFTLGTNLGSSATQAAANAAQIRAGGQDAQTAALLKSIKGLTDPVSTLIGKLAGATTTGTDLAGNSAPVFDYAYGGGGWY